MVFSKSLRDAASVGAVACVLAFAGAATAELLPVQNCDGVYGIGTTAYTKYDGLDISATTELTEVCWNEATAVLTSQETSIDLEKVSDQGGLARYQRLNGGSVDAINEQLEVGRWGGQPDGTMPYFRWTTEGSRSPEELNGNNSVSVEGFLVGPDGFAEQPQQATYDIEMQLTGVSGPLTSMAFGLFLPMQGRVTLDGENFELVVTGHEVGMGPSNLVFESELDTRFGNPSGSGTLTMDNEMTAGAPPDFWKRIELNLEEMATQFSGNEIALVANFVGEMENFAGAKKVVNFTLVGNGPMK